MLSLTRDTICFLRQSVQVMVRPRGQGTITLLSVHHHCRPLPRADVGRLLTCNNRNQKLMWPFHVSSEATKQYCQIGAGFRFGYKFHKLFLLRERQKRVRGSWKRNVTTVRE